MEEIEIDWCYDEAWDEIEKKLAAKLAADRSLDNVEFDPDAPAMTLEEHYAWMEEYFKQKKGDSDA